MLKIVTLNPKEYNFHSLSPILGSLSLPVGVCDSSWSVSFRSFLLLGFEFLFDSYFILCISSVVESMSVFHFSRGIEVRLFIKS